MLTDGADDLAPLRFGAFTLHPSERTLRRDGERVPVGPRALDVLCALAARPGALLTKDALLSIVWHGRVVEESNLHVQVSQLRRTIGADAIATVPGIGYRFVAPVTRASGVDGSVANVPDPAARPLSVLVTAFTEAGAMPGSSGFADAVTDDVVAQLAKIRGATIVVAPCPTGAAGPAPGWARAARDAGVRYVLHGRIERDGATVEVIARLSDAATHAVIWSDRIEVELDGVRRIRRELVARLATALDLELIQAEARHAAAGADAAARAHALVMQGRALGGSNWSRAHYERAIALYDRALDIAPDHAPALSIRALAHAGLAVTHPGPDIGERVRLAETDALCALALDSLDPLAHCALSMVRQQQYRLDDAMRAIDVSLGLDPTSMLPLSWKAMLHKLRGELDQARAVLSRVLELSPNDPHRWAYLMNLGSVELLAGRASEALPWLERSDALQPHWSTVWQMAAACATLGRVDRLPVLLRRLEGGLDGIERFRRWARNSDHPVHLQQARERIYAPLVAAGVLPDFAAADAWADRQRRRGAD
jgi:DNA-binding winged helix-turn-helix (wHTH) protein/tetratricopeptide (TPR) repeat protein